MNFFKESYKKVFSYFDKLEDKVRGHLSVHPILYALFGGILVVLFWRGVWHTGDLLQAKGGILGIVFSGPGSLLISLTLLLLMGLFVSVFVGDMIVMSGIKKEKKVVDKTKDELDIEETRIEHIEDTLEHIEKTLESMKTEKKIDKNI